MVLKVKGGSFSNFDNNSLFFCDLNLVNDLDETFKGE
tara:strand:+ start:146 stop:256 length:111 start_codon:yes stop_codon:yes gene_type:complete